MKIWINFLFISVLGLFGYGLYLQYYVKDEIYSKYMGIGVLIMVFVLLPFFLYHRYKDKNMADYKFRGFNPENYKNEKE